jgi:putative membrane protein
MKTLVRYDRHLEQEITFHPAIEMVLLVALDFLLLVLLSILGIRITINHLPFQAMTWTFGSLVLVHATYMVGWRRALTCLGLTLVISFLFEYAGVRTGLVFGRYQYTGVLSPLVLGTVPLAIPMAYFMVLWPSYLMANYLTRGKPAGKHPGLLSLLYASLLTALVMSAWDLTMDPVMVGEVKAWVRDNGGPYFGIPFRNFFGWVLTTFTISTAYRLLERGIPLKPLGRAHRGFIILPLIGYASLCLGDLLVGFPLGTRVLAPFTMGTAFLATLMRMYGPERTSRPTFPFLS